MKALFFGFTFESRLTILCQVVGSSLRGYFPFWRGDNPLNFSYLHSDSPVLSAPYIYIRRNGAASGTS